MYYRRISLCCAHWRRFRGKHFDVIRLIWFSRNDSSQMILSATASKESFVDFRKKRSGAWCWNISAVRRTQWHPFFLNGTCSKSQREQRREGLYSGRSIRTRKSDGTGGRQEVWCEDGDHARSIAISAALYQPGLHSELAWLKFWPNSI